MKNSILFFALIAISFSSFGQKKPPVKKQTTASKPVTSKFGALAIDRSNGFYYGWSFDYATLAEAEKKAVEECNAKGGNCTVVLSYSGSGCAAYRTIDGNVGTAFGWGFAKTKEAADAIATKECLKRSNGINPTNFVWSCNSANTGNIKEIYNASDEIFNAVKIGNQDWSVENIKIVRFRNGDPIQEAKSAQEWNSFLNEKKPAYMNLCHLSGQQNCGLIYNIYAVNDERKLAPLGWKIPSKSDWEQLNNYLGGIPFSAVKLASTNDWNWTNGTDTSGFNAKPFAYWEISSELKPSYPYGRNGAWWTSTMNKVSDIKNCCQATFHITTYKTSIKSEFGQASFSEGFYIRLVNE